VAPPGELASSASCLIDQRVGEGDDKGGSEAAGGSLKEGSLGEWAGLGGEV